MAKREKVIMTRVLRPGEKDDGCFDQEFWQRIGPEGIFAAAWEMVQEVEAIRGNDVGEPVFQRSISRVIRP